MKEYLHICLNCNEHVIHTNPLAPTCPYCSGPLSATGEELEFIDTFLVDDNIYFENDDMPLMPYLRSS